MKKRNPFKSWLLIACVFLLLIGNPKTHADINEENVQFIKNNYLIVLVHGIGDDYSCFEKVRNYLLGLGLSGYVHMYQFSDPFLNIEKEGLEFEK